MFFQTDMYQFLKDRKKLFGLKSMMREKISYRSLKGGMRLLLLESGSQTDKQSSMFHLGNAFTLPILS